MIYRATCHKCRGIVVLNKCSNCGFCLTKSLFGGLANCGKCGFSFNRVTCRCGCEIFVSYFRDKGSFEVKAMTVLILWTLFACADADNYTTVVIGVLIISGLGLFLLGASDKAQNGSIIYQWWRSRHHISANDNKTNRISSFGSQICPNCKSIIGIDLQFCTECGHEIPKPNC